MTVVYGVPYELVLANRAEAKALTLRTGHKNIRTLDLINPPNDINNVLETIQSNCKVYEMMSKNVRPPSVDPDVSGSGEPRVQDINTAYRVRSAKGLLQCRIIVQPKTFAEPVHGIHHHASLLFHHQNKIHQKVSINPEKLG